MVSVMIADDNTDLNKMYCKFLTNDKDINVISSTIDGKDTLEKYRILKPDILLLDLELPSMSGIEIINELCKDISERNKCNIIVISGNALYRYNLLNTSKIYRIMPKPVEIENIIQTIKEIKECEIQKEIPKKDLNDLLYSLNFNLYYNGTDYLIDAINIGYTNPILLKNIQELYTEVAKKRNISTNNVKWGIRNSIDTMVNNTNESEIYSTLKMVNTHRRMTPKCFIPLVVSYFLHN